MPEWLIELLTREPEKPKYERRATGEIVVSTDGPPIPSGSRNNTMFRILCRLRGDGLELPELEKAGCEIRQNRCEENPHDPFTDDDVRKIAAYVASHYTPNEYAEETVV